MKPLKVINIIVAILSIYHINYMGLMIFNKDGLNYDYPHLLGVNPFELLVLNFLLNIVILTLTLINVRKIVWDKSFKFLLFVNIVLIISFVIFCAFLYKYLMTFYSN